MDAVRTLAANDFVELTGAPISAVRSVLERQPDLDLRYREFDAREQTKIVAEVDDIIQHRSLRMVGGDDSRVWQDGWGEVAGQLKDRPITVEALRPQYFRGEPVCRMGGRFVRGLAPAFEYDVGLVLRQIVFTMFLGDVGTVAELGCGTGINLLLLAQQFPHLRLIGCDWAESSCDILVAMARQTGRSIAGHVFNMLTATGWSGSEIDRNTAVVTVHAMEQLGPNWRPFADFLRQRRPAFCLHIEPLLELYDDSPFDDLARRYHLKRNYLSGFHPYVTALAKSGAAELMLSRRVRFGGLHHEAYSILAWRPLG